MEYKLGEIARILGVHKTNCITKFVHYSYQQSYVYGPNILK